MYQGRPLHALNKSDHVLRAHHVCAQPALQSRIKGDVARRIEHDIDIAGDALGLFLAEAEIGVSDVSANDFDLVANKIVEGGAITFAHRIERLGANYILPKARL